MTQLDYRFAHQEEAVTAVSAHNPELSCAFGPVVQPAYPLWLVVPSSLLGSADI